MREYVKNQWLKRDRDLNLHPAYWIGFQLNVEINTHLLWFYFASLSDWLENLAPLS